MILIQPLPGKLEAGPSGWYDWYASPVAVSSGRLLNWVKTHFMFEKLSPRNPHGGYIICADPKVIDWMRS